MRGVAGQPRTDPLTAISFEMNPPQQIKKLRGHILIFSEHLRYLIQTFEVLLPMAQNDALLIHFAARRYSHQRVMANLLKIWRDSIQVLAVFWVPAGSAIGVFCRIRPANAGRAVLRTAYQYGCSLLERRICRLLGLPPLIHPNIID